MIRYLRARLAEPSTGLGLALIAAAALVAAYEWRVALGHAALALAGASLAALPDAILRRAWPLIEALAELPPESPPAPPGPSPQESVMTNTLITSVETAIEAAGTSALEDAVASFVPTVSADVGKLVTDVKTALVDAKAGKLGVVDVAKVLEDLAQAAIDLEAKLPPGATAAPVTGEPV